MQKLPAFIKATYEGEGKDDYALKAKFTMEGLADHPDEKDYILAYAACFLQIAGDYDGCIAHCEKYLPEITIWDCRQDTLNSLVWSFENTKRFAESIAVRKQLIEETARHKPGYESFGIQDMADAYKAAGDHKNAILYYEQYLTGVEAVETEFYTDLADLYETAGDMAGSAKYYLKALQQESDEHIWMWNNTGRALALAGKPDEAKPYLEIAIRLSPGNATAHYLLGQIYQDKEDMYRALHHYTEALKIKPAFSEVYNNLAAISYYENSDIQGAITNIETALAQNTNPKLLFILYRNLANLYQTIADYDKEAYYRAKAIESVGFVADYDFDEDDDEDEDEDWDDEEDDEDDDDEEDDMDEEDEDDVDESK